MDEQNFKQPVTQGLSALKAGSRVAAATDEISDEISADQRERDRLRIGVRRPPCEPAFRTASGCRESLGADGLGLTAWG